MTQNPDASPGRSRAVAHAAGAHASSGGSRFRQKAWLLLCLPVGLTTFAAFLYIGIRARRRRWLAWAGVYAATLAGWLVLDTPAHPGNTAQGVGAALALITWIGGGVHALVVSNDAVRRIQSSEDPAVEAAETRLERRAAGRRLLGSKPALAHEVGVGRPDIPGADDYGLIDVNHCPAAALTRLPGIGNDLAARIVSQREQAGGFSSVEDLGVLLDLAPATVDGLRDTAVFLSD
jgi:DNA uptake protein ComE-like DNA-binding protein